MSIAHLLILLPLVAAIPVVLVPQERSGRAALAGTLATFVVSLWAAFRFGHWSDGGFGLEGDLGWLAGYGVSLSTHADSTSLVLVLLTTLLMPLCVWGSATAVTHRRKEYYGWLMVLEAAMIGVFLAKDLVFFYVCFEFTLVPMYFLIAIHGGENRAHASIKFFIYTFTGSLIALAGLLYVAWGHAAAAGAWSFDIPALTAFAAANLDSTEQGLVLLALMAGFAVKVPLFPVHTWLPLAHTEAPTAGSVILAGVLLKLGTYGMYRFVLPMVPEAVVTYTPLIAGLAVVGILYAGLICWVQDDVKKLVAYSSVSHLGFCVLGLFALNPMGLQGSILYMVNHGLSTGALFFLIGMIYERYHTRDMNRLGGLGKRMPVWSVFMVFFVLASVGLPGLNGFVSEFLCLVAAFVASPDATPYPGVLGPWYAAFAGAGMIVAAMYLLIMTGKVVFGPLREPGHGGHGGHGGGHDEDGDGHGHDEHGLPADLTAREIGVLAPLAILCVVLGVQFKPLTDALAPAIERTLAAYPAEVERQRGGAEGPEIRAAEAEETPAAASASEPVALAVPDAQEAGPGRDDDHG